RLSDKRVLILTRSLDHEADIVGIELLRRGIDYVRLNVEDIPDSLKVSHMLEQDSGTESEIKLNSTVISLSDVSAVWLRNFDYGLIRCNSNELNAAFIFQQWNDALQILYNKIEHGWINSLNATYC